MSTLVVSVLLLKDLKKLLPRSNSKVKLMAVPCHSQMLSKRVFLLWTATEGEDWEEWRETL